MDPVHMKQSAAQKSWTISSAPKPKYLFIQKYVTKKRLAAKGEPATESRLPVGGGRTKKIIRKKKKDTYTETKQY
jgi:hypothetical protein